MGSDGAGDRRPVVAAVVATAVALTALNLLLAYVISGAVGARAMALPDVAVWLLAALAIACGVGAVTLWRRYARTLTTRG